jgi:LysM repeat protein
LTLPDDAFEPLPASGDSVPAKPTDTGTSPPTPASNPAAVTTAPQRYQVQAGDTLWSLARRFGTSVRALQAANGLGRRSTLRVGQWLRLP